MKYKNQKFDEHQSKVIQEAIKKGLTEEQIDLFADPKMDSKSMRDILLAFERGVDTEKIKLLANTELTYRDVNILSQTAQVATKEQLEMIINYYLSKDFLDPIRTLNAIDAALRNGIDIDKCLDFAYENIYEIINAEKEESDSDIKDILYDRGFSWGQKIILLGGLKKGLDISIYANPKFESWQMFEIREGLEKGVDVSVYADPKFDWRQMEQILWGLEEGKDVSWYADPKFNWRQMNQIYLGLGKDLDVSVYVDPNIDWREMKKIRESLIQDQDLDQEL